MPAADQCSCGAPYGTKAKCGFCPCFFLGSNGSQAGAGVLVGAKRQLLYNACGDRSGLGCLPLELLSVDRGKRPELSFTALA